LASAVSLTAEAKIGDFNVEYLCEFQALCKKALTHVSGAYEKLFDKKTWVENLLTLKQLIL
jgi:hypothetical protein